MMLTTLTNLQIAISKLADLNCRKTKSSLQGILCKLKQFLLVALCFGASQTITQHQEPFAYFCSKYFFCKSKYSVSNEKKLVVHNAKHKQELCILQLIQEINNIFVHILFSCKIRQEVTSSVTSGPL